MKIYNLNRKLDITGVSGTGIVAEVVEFSDGVCIVHWIGHMTLSNVSSIVIYNSRADLLAVHGHNGNTVLEEIHGATTEIR